MPNGNEVTPRDRYFSGLMLTTFNSNKTTHARPTHSSPFELCLTSVENTLIPPQHQLQTNTFCLVCFHLSASCLRPSTFLATHLSHLSILQHNRLGSEPGSRRVSRSINLFFHGGPRGACFSLKKENCREGFVGHEMHRCRGYAMHRLYTSRNVKYADTGGVDIHTLAAKVPHSLYLGRGEGSTAV